MNMTVCNIVSDSGAVLARDLPVFRAELMLCHRYSNEGMDAYIAPLSTREMASYMRRELRKFRVPVVVSCAEGDQLKVSVRFRLSQLSNLELVRLEYVAKYCGLLLNGREDYSADGLSSGLKDRCWLFEQGGK